LSSEEEASASTASSVQPKQLADGLEYHSELTVVPRLERA